MLQSIYKKAPARASRGINDIIRPQGMPPVGTPQPSINQWYGGNTMGGITGSNKIKPDQSSIIKYLMPGVQPEANAYLNEFAPARLDALRKAYQLMNPANVQGRLDAFRKKAQSAASMTADQGIRGLTPGYDPRMADAIRLGANNDAQRAGNAYQAKELSTEEQQKAFIQQLQLLDPEMSMPTINAIMKWLNQVPPKGPSGPSGLESLAGIAGSILSIPGVLKL